MTSSQQTQNINYMLFFFKCFFPKETEFDIRLTLFITHIK